MAKKYSPPTDYGEDLAIPLEPAPPGPSPTKADASADQPEGQDDTPPSRQPGYIRPILDRSEPTLMYLHPDGKYALKEWALKKHVKLHDVLLEAVEEWAAKRGIGGPFRVTPVRARRQRRSS